MINSWRKFIFRINDIYGRIEDQGVIPSADVHCYLQQPDFIDQGKHLTLHKKFKTLCIDLNKSEEQLRKELDRTTKYQVNRAIRDELSVSQTDTPNEQDIAMFIQFFNAFAKKKGIELCREDKVWSLFKNKALALSSVYHRNGQKLASHLCIADGKRVIGLYSGSVRFTQENIKQSEVGRANRFLHWQEILFFKRKGYDILDFYGLSVDKNNEAQQNINRFKKGFGGREETSCHSYVPVTLKGALLVVMLRFKWRHHPELVKKRTIGEEKHVQKHRIT